MNTTHTAGPWKVSGESNNPHEAFVIESDSRTIAWTTNSLDSDDNEYNSTEDKANAALLASSPAMVAALEEAWDYLNEPEGFTPDEVRALNDHIGIILNKAKGLATAKGRTR